MTESKTRARIGITWYNHSDYHAILEIMEDSDLLPSTFERWQGYAARRERREQRAGRIVTLTRGNIRCMVHPNRSESRCERALFMGTDHRPPIRDATFKTQCQVG